MTDEQAVKLANLLAEYTVASMKEGATLTEVSEWTVASVIGDIVQTTPQYLEGQLDSVALEMADL